MVARNFGYTFGRTEEGRARDYAELEKRLAQQPVVVPAVDPVQPTQPDTTQSPITVNPTSTNLAYWTIPNVAYRGKVGNVDVLNGLLDNGTSKTQDGWAAYSEKERASGQFYTPDYPLLYAALAKAFDLKDEKVYKQKVKEMRIVLKDLSRNNWLMTLTRIKYQPKGKDILVHNFGMKDKYEILEDFVGADGELPAGSPERVYRNLLGTTDSSDRIKKTFNWLNDTNTSYIWRVNSKPNSVDERVAWFIAGSDRAYLGCDRYPSGSDSSLGVRFVASGAS